jgi:hypothetical protein
MPVAAANILALELGRSIDLACLPCLCLLLALSHVEVEFL